MRTTPWILLFLIIPGLAIGSDYDDCINGCDSEHSGCLVSCDNALTSAIQTCDSDYNYGNANCDATWNACLSQCNGDPTCESVCTDAAGDCFTSVETDYVNCGQAALDNLEDCISACDATDSACRDYCEDLDAEVVSWGRIKQSYR